MTIDDARLLIHMVATAFEQGGHIAELCRSHGIDERRPGICG